MTRVFTNRDHDRTSLVVREFESQRGATDPKGLPPDGVALYQFESPAAGIPARNGTDVTGVEVDLYHIELEDPHDELKRQYVKLGNQKQVVFNTIETDVPGSRQGFAARGSSGDFIVWGWVCQ